MSRKNFNPIGAPVFLAATGSSLNGGVRPGEDGELPFGEGSRVGNFFIEDYEDFFDVYFYPNGEGDDDDGYYILVDDAWEEIDWNGPWNP